jgi:hypothetical protein
MTANYVYIQIIYVLDDSDVDAGIAASMSSGEQCLHVWALFTATHNQLEH